MTDATVTVGGRDAPLLIRINGAQPTFSLRTDRIESRTLTRIDPLIADLLDIACVVFAADSSVPRGGSVRQNMGAAWRRRFDFEIPVRNRKIWADPAVTDLLVEAVTFLTDDVVTFDFTDHLGDEGGQQFLDFDPSGVTFAAEDVVLFSGGLDSFAGALEMLATTSRNLLLVSHRSAQKVFPRQKNLGAYLAHRFPGRVEHIHVDARRKGKEASDTTQRSRSFLFAALGQAVVQAFGGKRLWFFENGIVSHNLPISPQVVGTMATRTTHPLALDLMNRLFDRLGGDLVPIHNAYQWLTKTEIVGRIVEHGGAEQIARSSSCTSIRDQTTLHTHCGTCSQCLDRRFAVLANGLDHFDPVESYKTDVLFGPRDTPHSKTMAVEWTRHALSLDRLEINGFLDRFGLEFGRIARGHRDLTTAQAMAKAHDMHVRHGKAVRQVLKTCIAAQAAAIAGQQLEQTSLLAMHLGTQQRSSAVLPPDPRENTPVRDTNLDGPAEDLVPDADGPLKAAFFEEDGRHVVAVSGLGRVVGAPAKVAHGLKPAFDADRSEGRAPDDHHYVLPHHIFPSSEMTPATARQNIARCRRELGRFYRDVFGSDPPDYLLIQSRQWEGYRLDPILQLTTRDAVGS